MTLQADIVRSRRRRFALPGGFHDRLVRTLSVVLPAIVGVLAAIMVLAPLSPRGEISFLLDRNKVEVVPDRLRMEDAMYRGQDNQGRGFSITAGGAVQRTSRRPVVEMDDLIARLMMRDGPAVLAAEAGAYNYRDDEVRAFGPVTFEHSDGYRMLTRDVDIDLDTKRMVSRGRVEGRIPAGTFSADRVVADLTERTVTLDGNARLRMNPGQMQMPR